jgi:large subunit ribosomal protein L29
MKSAEMRGMDDSEIRESIATARKELFGLRFQHATGELENTAGLRQSKRDLARALTIARQRGIDPTEKTTEKTA